MLVSDARQASEADGVALGPAADAGPPTMITPEAGSPAPDEDVGAPVDAHPDGGLPARAGRQPSLVPPPFELPPFALPSDAPSSDWSAFTPVIPPEPLRFDEAPPAVWEAQEPWTAPAEPESAVLPEAGAEDSVWTVPTPQDGMPQRPAEPPETTDERPAESADELTGSAAGAADDADPADPVDPEEENARPLTSPPGWSADLSRVELFRSALDDLAHTPGEGVAPQGEDLFSAATTREPVPLDARNGAPRPVDASGGWTSEPPAAEVPSQPPADELPAQPPADELPAQPPADELPAQPPADELPVPRRDQLPTEDLRAADLRPEGLPGRGAAGRRAEDRRASGRGVRGRRTRGGRAAGGRGTRERARSERALGRRAGGRLSARGRSAGGRAVAVRGCAVRGCAARGCHAARGRGAVACARGRRQRRGGPPCRGLPHRTARRTRRPRAARGRDGVPLEPPAHELPLLPARPPASLLPPSSSSPPLPRPRGRLRRPRPPNRPWGALTRTTSRRRCRRWAARRSGALRPSGSRRPSPTGKHPTRATTTSPCGGRSGPCSGAAPSGFVTRRAACP